MAAQQSGPGPVVVITGGAGGIGGATARAMSRDGWRLALVDRPGEALDRAVAGLTAAGATVLAVPADVRRPEQAEAGLATVVDRFGGVDALVTCAGIGRIEPAEQTSDQLWEDTLAVNLSGTFYWCRAALPRLRERGGGVIVAVASTTALVGLPGRAAYAASKAGVVGLARTLAIECAADRIRVIPLCPGATRTELVQQGYAAAPDPAAAAAAHARQQPIGRLSEPEEIAETIAFLCSPRAATITGATVVVDGGYTAGGPSWNT